MGRSKMCYTYTHHMASVVLHGLTKLLLHHAPAYLAASALAAASAACCAACALHAETAAAVMAALATSSCRGRTGSDLKDNIPGCT